MPFFAFDQLVTTFIIFSTRDKSRVKWDNSRKSTQRNQHESAKLKSTALQLKFIA